MVLDVPSLASTVSFLQCQLGENSLVLELPSFAAELQSSIAKLGKLRFCLEFAELGIRSFGVEFPSLANSEVSMLSCRGEWEGWL